MPDGFYMSPDEVRAGMDKAKGRSLDAVIPAWGYPAAEKIIVGKRLVSWHRGDDATAPAAKVWCDMTWEVSNEGVLLHSNWSGNICGVYIAATKAS